MDHDTLLNYLDFYETFKIHTDASDFQLGVFIVHKGKTIAFYGRKVNESQKSYTVTETDILRILENVKEFITILPGQILRIYTDHETLKCQYFNTDRVLIWRLILEEYAPEIEYIRSE